MPGDRVIVNLTARLAKDPTNAELRYLLGRAYYALYCNPHDKNVLYLYGTDTEPKFPTLHPSHDDLGQANKPLDQARLDDIRSAIRHLKAAVKLGGGLPGLYPLTLACAYEVATPVAAKVEKGKTPEEFKKLALSQYVASFKASRDLDLKQEFGSRPLTYEKWISVEAAESILRLAPKHSLKGEIETHMAAMSKLPSGPITPLIFSLIDAKPLDNLLDPFSLVRFDLDGTGQPQTYQWVRPDTAFLVWQPDPRVPIRSGRQLFGSATWWLMNRDAYAAMSLLDDNRDGWLSGSELRGLAIWTDSNQDGVSERGEVVSAQIAGIAALRTVATGRVGESLVSSGGLRLRDGRVLPTYDWVTRGL